MKSAIGGVRAARAQVTPLAAAAAGRMVAWRVHAYGEDARAEAARVPPLRAPSQLLVRVHAASLNPIDGAMAQGYGATLLNVLRTAEGGDGVEFPLVPGRDFAGVVVRAGAAASLRAGAKVWGVVPPHRQGALAEYVVVEDRWAGAMPSGMPVEQAGGALYAALTACAALRAAGLAPGEGGAWGQRRRRPRVLLLGVGGVGHAALQLLLHAGATVVVGCSGDVCASALALGASAALDRHSPEYDRHLAEHGPYDVILDCAGLGGWEASARPWRFSRYVTLTTPLLREMDARGLALGGGVALAALAGQCMRTCAAAASPSATPHVRWAFFAPNPNDVELLRRLAERDQFHVAVERVFGWWECEAAMARLAAQGARGKILVDWTKAPPHEETVASIHTSTA